MQAGPAVYTLQVVGLIGRGWPFGCPLFFFGNNVTKTKTTPWTRATAPADVEAWGGS